MVAVGTKVRILDLADHLLQEGIVKKISNRKAIVKFPRAKGEFEYNIDDLEEVKPIAKSAKSKQK